jgi:Ras-related protein Rab-32
MYYREAKGAFIVFDVSKEKSFQAVQKWKADIDLKVQLPNGDPIPVVLLANKVLEN